MASIVRYALGLRGASGFGSSSTAQDVGDALQANIAGKTCVVTGVGARGLGLEATRIMLVHGATVIVLARNPDEAGKHVKEAVGDKVDLKRRLYLVKLDLASLVSVRECAKEIECLKLPIDTLVLNAGVFMCPHLRTKDDMEMQFGTNVAGHFLLCNLLMPSLVKTCRKRKDAPRGRIVIISSSAHHFASLLGGMDFEDLNYKHKTYNAALAYAYSKLGSALYAEELQRRIDQAGLGDNLIAVSVHPGAIPGTNVSRHMKSGYTLVDVPMDFAVGIVSKVVFKSVGQGAATHVYTAFADHAVLRPHAGMYFADCNVAEASSAARDEKMAKELWHQLTELTASDWRLKP